MNQQLSKYAADIIKKRIAFIDTVKQTFIEIFDFIVNKKIRSRMEYKTGFPDVSENALLQSFNQIQEKEFFLGRTLIGPHRDDLVFYFNDSVFRNVGSLGQMRIIGIVLKLLYIEYMIQQTQDIPVVLIDDVLLELDEFHKNRVVDFLNQYNNLQTFECTTTEHLYKNLEQYHIVPIGS